MMEVDFLHILLSLMLSCISFQQSHCVTVEEFIESVRNGTDCNVHVCDQSKILTLEEEQKLGNLTNDIKSSVLCAACDCVSSIGLSISVNTVSNITYSSSNKTVQSIENDQFATKVRKNLNLSSCGNDMVILLIDKTTLIVSKGPIAEKNIPAACTGQLLDQANHLSKHKYMDAFESALWSARTIYRNSKATSWPACFGKPILRASLSPTIIILIVLSIVVAIGLIAFVVWHIIGQQRLRYLDYNPNQHIRFSNYAGMSDFGSAAESTPPSTVAGEYAAWKGSVSEGTFENPGFEERRGSMRAC